MIETLHLRRRRRFDNGDEVWHEVSLEEHDRDLLMAYDEWLYEEYGDDTYAWCLNNSGQDADRFLKERTSPASGQPPEADTPKSRIPDGELL